MPRRKKRRRSRLGPPSSDAWDALYPTLDLHGETVESARRRTERWLRARQEDGSSVVRVITGRGLHSLGPPVLRGEIEDLLSSLRGAVVDGYTPESGGGAYRVELRRPERLRSTRRPPGGGAPGHAATGREELRARALEALADLGVTPTPALIELEVRRMMREEES